MNAELSTIESADPDTTLYRDVSARYAKTTPLGNFGQMGFLTAKIVTDTLMELPTDGLTRESVNEALLWDRAL